MAYSVQLKNDDAPIRIHWTGTLQLASDVDGLDASQKEYVLGSGKKVTLILDQSPGQASPSISLETADGNQKLTSDIQLKPSGQLM